MGIPITFKIGVETFNNDFRENYLNKHADFTSADAAKPYLDRAGDSEEADAARKAYEVMTISKK